MSAKHCRDSVFEAFLAGQHREIMAFAEQSDLLDIVPVHGSPPDRYRVVLSCRGLVKLDGRVVPHEHFELGIAIAPDYLARVNPFQLVSWLEPDSVFAPNIGRGGFRQAGPIGICIGGIPPALPLTELVIQIADVITGHVATLNEFDALNPEACRWFRSRPGMLPTDDRPLFRRRIQFEVELDDGDQSPWSA